MAEIVNPLLGEGSLGSKTEVPVLLRGGGGGSVSYSEGLKPGGSSLQLAKPVEIREAAPAKAVSLSDLSKAVDRLEYFPDTGRVVGWKDGVMKVSKKGVSPETLPSYVGKEAAEQLLNSQPYEGGQTRSVPYFRIELGKPAALASPQPGGDMLKEALGKP